MEKYKHNIRFKPGERVPREIQKPIYDLLVKWETTPGCRLDVHSPTSKYGVIVKEDGTTTDNLMQTVVIGYPTFWMWQYCWEHMHMFESLNKSKNDKKAMEQIEENFNNLYYHFQRKYYNSLTTKQNKDYLIEDLKSEYYNDLSLKFWRKLLFNLTKEKLMKGFLWGDDGDDAEKLRNLLISEIEKQELLKSQIRQTKRMCLNNLEEFKLS